MRKRGWPALAGMQLMLEAQQVIGLRMAKLVLGGPAAATEARLMVDEKVRAAMRVAGLIAAGAARGDSVGGSDAAVRMLRRTVRANRKRLARGD